MSRWSDFLEAAPACSHGVQLYGDLAELADSVTAYLRQGFESGAPAIVIATDEHLALFTAQLRVAGWDPDALAADGLLTTADAETTLASFMVAGAPSPERFEAVAGGLLDTVAQRFAGKTIRAFGEMVDLLVRRGEPSAADALEQLWNDLAEKRPFALLCGYQLDVFDHATQVGPLPDVCRAHSHVRPVADPARLSTAVDRALTEVLGPVAAAQVYLSVATDIPRGKLLRGQAILMWLSAHQPLSATRVLSRARSHYHQLPSVVAR